MIKTLNSFYSVLYSIPVWPLCVLPSVIKNIFISLDYKPNHEETEEGGGAGSLDVEENSLQWLLLLSHP